MNSAYKAALCFIFCALGIVLTGSSQSTEDSRAKNFLALYKLQVMQEMAPYYLTSKDLADIQLLQEQTQEEACANAQSASCPAVILPVTGLKLAGQRLNPEQAQLNWETLAEYNSRGFVLERQSLYNPVQFDSMVFVAGAGTSYSKRKYSYTDPNSQSSSSFYRVRQVDIDGKFTYSNIVMIDGVSRKLAIVVAPNPATGHTAKVYFRGLTTNQVVSLTVSNAVGKRIIKKEAFKPGNGYVELNSQLLSSGYYFVSVYTNGEVHTASFSIVN